MAVFQRDIYNISAGTVAFSGTGNRTVTFTGIGSGLAVSDGAGNLVSKFGKGATLRVGMASAQVATVDSATQLTLAHDVSSPMTGSGVSYILTTATADEALIAGLLQALANKGMSLNPFQEFVWDNGTHRARIISNGNEIEMRVGLTSTGSETATVLAFHMNRSTGVVTIPSLSSASLTALLADYALTINTRPKLTANRTYYVRTDGNNSNNGLANTAGGAFATIQKAIDTTATLDLGIYNVTIQLGSGTWTTGGIVSGAWVGSGTVTINGNGAANTTLNVTSGNGITCLNGAHVTVNNATLRGTTAGTVLRAEKYGIITVGTGAAFGTSTGCDHCYADTGGIITFAGGYTISGNARIHMLATDGGQIIQNAGSVTVTLTGTPAWGTAGIYAQRGGRVSLVGITYSGAATGKRYEADTQASIILVNVVGGAFPGDVNGSADAATFSLYRSF